MKRRYGSGEKLDYPVTPANVQKALRLLDFAYPPSFSETLADLINQSLTAREQEVFLQCELQRSILRDLVTMFREPRTELREQCLRIDAVRAEKILDGARPLPENPNEEFKTAIHQQEAFKLNADTIAAAKWGWYTALGKEV